MGALRRGVGAAETLLRLHLVAGERDPEVSLENVFNVRYPAGVDDKHRTLIADLDAVALPRYRPVIAVYTAKWLLT